MSKRMPLPRREAAVVFPPGDYIRGELQARRWSRKRFAEHMDRSEHEILDLLRGVAPVTPEVAEDLARVFGTSARMWLNLEAAWQAGSEAAKARYREGEEADPDA